MTLTDAEQKSIRGTLDDVLAQGPKDALGWLQGAFWGHEESLKRLLAEKAELVALFLAAVARPLTVREAQLCRVCRVCWGPSSNGPAGWETEFGRVAYPTPFRLNFGAEFAHEGCLENGGGG